MAVALPNEGLLPNASSQEWVSFRWDAELFVSASSERCSVLVGESGSSHWRAEASSGSAPMRAQEQGTESHDELRNARSRERSWL